MPKQVADKKKMLIRVHRIQGQVQAIERALGEDVPCTQLLQQLCAIRGAMDGLMRELLQVHLKDELVDGDTTSAQRAKALTDINQILTSYFR
ncbi:metal/formaldehyde-sensitive transcriptional repressor [Snodgrassella sp. CFCC 13594]|jgi:DNA-binding FrmR family transcriptional regulator|uniref:metal/formaldehyde-sensitive transcriptional repressor n=1 Tax=Snodgrassella sp. CFCC 13594 TaxID=1775559 RepID=UPI000832DD6C|nr:metal/formaldehyde-sensitive transcriptional repressor [Snodgrassella sp. CFCC 13594]